MIFFRNRNAIWNHLRNTKKPKRPSHHNNKPSQRQIPEQYKRPVQLNQQVHKMQVASQALADATQIKALIQQQRQKLQQNDQDIKIWFIPKIIIGVTAGNALGLATCLAVDRFYVGMWVAGVLHPCYIGVSAILVGYNAAYLIMNHGLKLHLSPKQLRLSQQLQLLKSPWQIWAKVSYLICDVILILWLNNKIMIGVSRQVLAGYVLLTLALIWQSSRAAPKIMVNAQKSLQFAVLAYCVLYGIYMIVYMFPAHELEEGIESIRTRYKYGRIKVSQEPLNLSLKEEQK